MIFVANVFTVYRIMGTLWTGIRYLPHISHQTDPPVPIINNLPSGIMQGTPVKIVF